MRYYNCPLSSLARERLRELCSPLPIVVTLLPASLSPHWPTGRWLYKLYSLIYRTNLAPCKGVFVSHFVSDCTCTFSTSKGRKTHLHQTQCLFLLCRGCTVYMHVCNMHVHVHVPVYPAYTGTCILACSILPLCVRVAHGILTVVPQSKCRHHA